MFLPLGEMSFIHTRVNLLLISISEQRIFHFSVVSFGPVKKMSLGEGEGGGVGLENASHAHV